MPYEHQANPCCPGKATCCAYWDTRCWRYRSSPWHCSSGWLATILLAGLSWIDSLLNASMILGGMGPVDLLTTVPAKLFASFYALFAGVAFLAIAGVLIAPIAHRFLHRLHLEIGKTTRSEVT